MEGQYNMRSPAVKRLMKEAQELRNPTEEYYAQPLEDNLFEWHFTVRGPPDTDFDGGTYHGRIVLPPEYPMKPPSIILLTPNGRFETNKKICLSISGHHPESWQPSWSIRTALLAIVGFMPTHGNGAIGSLDYRPEERLLLAKKSCQWVCPACGPVARLMPPCTRGAGVSAAHLEARALASQISFQGTADGTGSVAVRSLSLQPDADAAADSSADATPDGRLPLPPDESSVESARQRRLLAGSLLQQKRRSRPPPREEEDRRSGGVASTLLICLVTALFTGLLIRRLFFL